MKCIASFLASAALLSAWAGDLPVIKVTTRLVQVDVVVHDSKGSVSGLTRDDFRLFDQGKPQKLALFQVNTAASQSAAASTPSPSQSEAFTNRTADTGPAIVILLDQFLTSPMDQRDVRLQLLKYLKNVQPRDRIAIYQLGAGVQLVQPFTGNSAALIHALELARFGEGYLPNPLKPDAAFLKARAIPNAELSARVTGVSATFIQSNVAPPAGRVRQECIGLIALAHQLATVPGRKNLFWFTDGFPLVAWSGEPQIYVDEVSQVNHAFSDGNVAVYPVDAHGLRGTGMTALTSTPTYEPATGSGAIILMGGKGSPAIGTPTGGQDTLQYVAAHTGGQAFVNSNDLVAPIHQIQREANVTYTLGFYPETALDSRRHSLKVEVDRKGVTLQYRKDYWAGPELPETRLPEEAQIIEAIWNPVNSTGVTLALHAEKVDQPQAGMLRLTLSIDSGTLSLQPADQGWSGTLAVLYDQRSAGGQGLGRISETLSLHLDDEQYRKLSSEGITYQRLVRPSPEAAQIRVVVYDRGSGRLGSVAAQL